MGNKLVADMTPEERKHRLDRDRKWREANREKVRENHRKYREANREKIREIQRKYCEENPEKVRETHRRYCEANREKILKQSRKWARKSRARLTDRYIKHILTDRSSLKFEDIPQELVEAKRELLRLERYLKTGEQQ